MLKFLLEPPLQQAEPARDLAAAAAPAALRQPGGQKRQHIAQKQQELDRRPVRLREAVGLFLPHHVARPAAHPAEAADQLRFFLRQHIQQNGRERIALRGPLCPGAARRALLRQDRRRGHRGHCGRRGALLRLLPLKADGLRLFSGIGGKRIGQRLLLRPGAGPPRRAADAALMDFCGTFTHNDLTDPDFGVRFQSVRNKK